MNINPRKKSAPDLEEPQLREEIKQCTRRLNGQKKKNPSN